MMNKWDRVIDIGSEKKKRKMPAIKSLESVSESRVMDILSTSIVLLLFQRKEKKENDAGREVIRREAGAVLFTGTDSFV